MMDKVIKMKALINRISWRVYVGVNKGNNYVEMNEDSWENVFKTTKTPPTTPLLYSFKEAIWEMMRETKFRKYPNRRNQYLRELNLKRKDWRNSKTILVL